jgi:uncharacterized protein (DUF433 family)/DNA-binding transcriptional MerR regulator
MTPRGAYPANRAAALSGVPKSTVHYWAREDILVPTLSAERVKLWSYADLMGLRVVYWLRHGTQTADGEEVGAQSMPTVRKALASLRELDLELWSEDRGPAVAIDRSGKLILDPKGLPGETSGQRVAGEVLELMHPFPTEEGTKGPDLRTPRPHLRIVPGKLAGEPHVARSRVETQALAALSRRGMGTGKIAQLYPSLEAAAIDEAIDLERQLSRNLSIAA